jgi:hypothetical protein
MIEYATQIVYEAEPQDLAPERTWAEKLGLMLYVVATLGRHGEACAGWCEHCGN